VQYGKMNYLQIQLCLLLNDCSHDQFGIDFTNVTMDGQSPFGDVNNPGECETNMFLFKGIDHWTTPPECGELTGYSCT